jgi:hypothetical protein
MKTSSYPLGAPRFRACTARRHSGLTHIRNHRQQRGDHVGRPPDFENLGVQQGRQPGHRPWTGAARRPDMQPADASRPSCSARVPPGGARADSGARSSGSLPEFLHDGQSEKRSDSTRALLTLTAARDDHLARLPAAAQQVVRSLLNAGLAERGRGRDCDSLPFDGRARR